MCEGGEGQVSWGRWEADALHFRRDSYVTDLLVNKKEIHVFEEPNMSEAAEWRALEV